VHEVLARELAADAGFERVGGIRQSGWGHLVFGYSFLVFCDLLLMMTLSIVSNEKRINEQRTAKNQKRITKNQ
jgi:hypothetical protein